MSNEYKVQDQYRTNPLSHQPGGSEVKVYLPGETRVYDKVKSVKGYLSALVAKGLKSRDILRVEVNGKLYWDQNSSENLL